MNNANAETYINRCMQDLTRMKTIIEGLGPLSTVVPFFNNHAAVIASGAIEQSFKTIIADSFLAVPSIQLQNFVDAKIRDSSMNPSLSNIHSTLLSFDEAWNDAFKAQLSSHPDAAVIRDAFTSLVNARNTVAHGKDSTITLEDIMIYFNHAQCAITMIDNIVR